MWLYCFFVFFCSYKWICRSWIWCFFFLVFSSKSIVMIIVPVFVCLWPMMSSIYSRRKFWEQIREMFGAWNAVSTVLEHARISCGGDSRRAHLLFCFRAALFVFLVAGVLSWWVLSTPWYPPPPPTNEPLRRPSPAAAPPPPSKPEINGQQNSVPLTVPRGDDPPGLIIRVKE